MTTDSDLYLMAQAKAQAEAEAMKMKAMAGGGRPPYVPPEMDIPLQAIEENTISQMLIEKAAPAAEFLLPSPAEATEFGGTMQGVKSGAALGSVMGLPGKVMGGITGGLIGNFLGNVGGQAIETKGQDIEIPSAGETALRTGGIYTGGKIADFVGKGLAGGIEKFGARRINEAQRQLGRILDVKVGAVKDLIPDDIAEEMVPDILRSFGKAKELGVFKGKLDPASIGFRVSDLSKKTGEGLGKALKSADAVLTPEQVKNKLLSTVDDVQQYINKNYKDGKSIEKASGVLADFKNDIQNNVNSLLDAQQLKRNYYVERVNFNEQSASFDKVLNSTNREIAGKIKNSIEDLYKDAAIQSGKVPVDVIKKLNNELGALFDVEGVIGNTISRGIPAKEMSTGQVLANTVALNAPFAAAAAGAPTMGVLGSTIPAAYIGGQAVMTSPTGRLARAGMGEMIGKPAQAIGKFTRNATEILKNKVPFLNLLAQVGVSGPIIDTTEQILSNGTMQQIEAQLNELITQSAEAQQAFEPPEELDASLRGYKSLFNNKILDPYEQFAYTQQLKDRERIEEVDLTDDLYHLNVDGTVLSLKGKKSSKPLDSGTVVGIPKVDTESDDSSVGDESKRQVTDY